MARRALKNISLGVFTLYVLNLIQGMVNHGMILIMMFAHTTAYLASLDDLECTELSLNEYRTATNLTDQFAALAAITQIPGNTADEVLADFYKKWEHDFLVSSHRVCSREQLSFFFRLVSTFG